MIVPVKTLATATAVATGGRNGHSETTDKSVSVDLSVPKAMGGPGKPDTTTPEHLFAAGYAACFGGALDFVAKSHKKDASKAKITCAVGIGPREAGGFGLVVDLKVEDVESAAGGAAAIRRRGAREDLSLFARDARQRRGDDHRRRRLRRRVALGRRACLSASGPPDSVSNAADDAFGAAAADGRSAMDDRARAAAEPLTEVTLADRFDIDKTHVLLNGVQAVARLLLMQKARDRRAGLNTAGFASGYRGSPLGGLDQQFLKLASQFAANDIHFEPGLNEELAATAIWGAQQAELRGEGRFDGVFGLWYGKGPGVDRSGDAFRHANLAGTSPHGGVLALMGDDPTAESSTTAHQSEFAFVDAMMPILAPAGVQEILDYGALGWALSRYAGVWVGLKCVKDTIESTAVVDASLDRVAPVAPADFPLPPGGLNIRRVDGVLAEEERLHEHKLPAVVAWLAANRLDRVVIAGGGAAKLGVVTVGKSYLDVRQALDALDLDEARCDELGLKLYKVACPWPVEPHGLKAFADGLEEIVVVEEKRSLIETQLREILYGAARPPVVVGKRDEAGQWLLPSKGALDPQTIAIAIGERLIKLAPDARLEAALARVKATRGALAELREAAVRTPYFCSGCPHNRSTVVPEGARAYAGIGCHYMALFMDRATEGFTQMGGEGANWIGEAHFSNRRHVFQNLGDGTYNHSGALALRWAIDAKVNVTYKILFNDAVAMTGGQHLEGGLTPPQIAAQVVAEGAERVVVVADDPSKYPRGHALAGGRGRSPARRAYRRRAGAGRDRRRHGADLRPDLRRREATAAQARPLSRSRQARVHQRRCLRGLRRLRRQVELRLGAAARHRIRAQAAHRPIGLQQGLFLRRRLLPVVRHRRRGATEGARRGDRAAVLPRAAAAAGRRQALRDSGQRRRRDRRGDGRRHAGDGGASRRQGRGDDRHGRPGAEGRRGVQPRQDRLRAPRTSTPCGSGRAKPIWCLAAISSPRAPSRRWRRCAPARPPSSSTAPSSSPAVSRASRTLIFRASG